MRDKMAYFRLEHTMQTVSAASHSHRSHMPWVWRFFDRLWWMPATLLATAAATLTCTPAVLTGRPVDLPTAYLAKAENPFADTTLLPLADPANFAEFGPWSHGAKLTPRIVPALLLAGTCRLGWHPYIPATVGGIVLLASVIVATARATGDRFVGTCAGCTAAGLYASAACFAIPFQPKPFDGVALGIVGLTTLAAVSGPAAGLAAAVAVDCLSDERALVAIIGCAWIAAFSAPAPEKLRIRMVAIALGILAFGIVRLGLGMACGWSRPDGTLIDSGILRHTLPAAGLAARVAFEAAAAPIVLLAGLVARRRSWGILTGWLATIVVSLVSCLVVLDTSRAAAFLVPFVPAAWAGLSACGLRPGFMRPLSLATAIACILVPTLDVIAGVHAIALARWLG